jgi:hypothetical protein
VMSYVTALLIQSYCSLADNPQMAVRSQSTADYTLGHCSGSWGNVVVAGLHTSLRLPPQLLLLRHVMC